ncbi:hypothetical protein NQZ68_034388, partial [Dissostichus eleginoides]
ARFAVTNESEQTPYYCRNEEEEEKQRCGKMAVLQPPLSAEGFHSMPAPLRGRATRAGPVRKLS